MPDLIKLHDGGRCMLQMRSKGRGRDNLLYFAWLRSGFCRQTLGWEQGHTLSVEQKADEVRASDETYKLELNENEALRAVAVEE